MSADPLTAIRGRLERLRNESGWVCSMAQECLADLSRLQAAREGQKPTPTELFTRYHVVSQQDHDSWLVRVKRPGEASNVDDLVLADQIVIITARACESAAEVRSYRRAFAVCAEHHPDKWEGDGTCVLCEGQRQADQIADLTAQVEELLTPMKDISVELHEIFTQHGLASLSFRDGRETMISEIISWAARACRQSQSAAILALTARVEQAETALRQAHISGGNLRSL